MISLVSSVAIACTMFASFATVSQAKTEDQGAEIYVTTSVDEFGFYCVNYNFKLKDQVLGLASRTEGRTTYFTGSAIYASQITVNGVTAEDIYVDGMFASNLVGYTGNVTDSALMMTGAGSTVATLVGSGETVVLASISTNYETSQITEDALIEKFSDFGFTSVKIATVSDLVGTTAIDNSMVTTYAVGHDGFTKDIDADYAMKTPETPAAPAGTAMVAGKDITEGFYAGKTSVSTPEAVVKTDIETIEVSNDKKGATQTASLPTVVGGGKSKILTIIVYDKTDAELKGSIFTVKYLNAAGTALNTYTYQVPAN